MPAIESLFVLMIEFGLDKIRKNLVKLEENPKSRQQQTFEFVKVGFVGRTNWKRSDEPNWMAVVSDGLGNAHLASSRLNRDKQMMNGWVRTRKRRIRDGRHKIEESLLLCRK